MIAVLQACGGAVLPAIERSLPTERVVAAGDWEALARLAGQVDCNCVVVYCPWISAEVVAGLEAFVGEYPLRPVVLVTTGDADNVRRIRGLQVDEVLWPAELPSALATAVQRARARRGLHRIAARLVDARGLTPTMRAALERACIGELPAATVRALAQAMRVDRRTLWRGWRAATRAVAAASEGAGAAGSAGSAGAPSPPGAAGAPNGAAALRLEDVLDWVILLRALGVRQRGRAWREVAAELGVHEHTLARLARRLTGQSLAALGDGGFALASAQFERDVLARLTVAS
jgi:hypothetical protein